MKRWLLILVCAASASAATYYVRTDGNNSNTGTANTAGGAKLTIAGAHAVATAGDTVRVQAGTYNEKPTITTSGSAGNFINYVADGTAICRGFDIQASYVRAIGFEVTHVDTSWGRGFEFNGTKNHIEIIDNYIHNTYQSAILGRIDSQPTQVIIRGNIITDTGLVPGVTTNATIAVGNAYTSLHTDHWLVEYNTITWSLDFVNVYGTNMWVRNNSLRHFSNAHFGASDSDHGDTFQPGSDGASTRTRYHIYERNFAGDSLELNSHFGIFQDTSADGDTDILIRGNIGFYYGSGGIGVRGADRVFGLWNTFYKLCQASDQATWLNYESGADFSLGCRFQNNIVADDGLGTDAIGVQAGNSLTADHNLGYLAGSEASYASTADPLFVAPLSYNYRLQSGSPARALGASPITIASATSSGTTFTVNDGLLLCDGWGLANGDTITVNATTTRITAISGNVVTVADSVSWTLGDQVHWGTSTTEDVGALPFASTELTAATISNVSTAYTVTPTGDCRMVIFYTDGVPTSIDYDSPFTATIPSGTVTAKAYALYAQATPVVTATAGSAPVTPSTASGYSRAKRSRK